MGTGAAGFSVLLVVAAVGVAATAAAVAPPSPAAEDGNASVSSFSADMVSCELLFGMIGKQR